jgi:hypothetical protein
MRYIQGMSRSSGHWKTICITNDPNPEVGSDDSIEVYWALRNGEPIAFHTLRIIDDAGQVIEGGWREKTS